MFFICVAVVISIGNTELRLERIYPKIGHNWLELLFAIGKLSIPITILIISILLMEFILKYI
jgi:hypothetical protein